MIKLNLLQVKQVVLQITFPNVVMFIMSVVNEQKINYYNIFLGKGSYKDKSNTEHFQMVEFK